ncbi:MAG: catalase HPII, partial [Pedobacter sp.]
YGPNSLANNDPQQVKAADGGFTSYQERVDARKVRARSGSFLDHFSQAKLFFNSQSAAEQNHIIDALSFELGKVKSVAIRQRMLGILSMIDDGLAAAVAYALGLKVPKTPEQPINHSIPADGDPADFQPTIVEGKLAKSAALSMENTVKDNIKTRKIAILVADGVDASSVNTVKAAIIAAGGVVEVIAPKLGDVIAADDSKIAVEESFLTAASVFYDAVYVPGGTNSVATLEAEANAVHFLNEAFRHCKAIAADEQAMQVIEATYFSKKLPEDFSDDSVLKEGVVIGSDAGQLAKQFIKAIAQHRFWDREKPRQVPA